MSDVYRLPDGRRYAVTGHGFAVCAKCCGEGIEAGIGRNGQVRCRACRGTGDPPVGAEDHHRAMVARAEAVA